MLHSVERWIEHLRTLADPWCDSTVRIPAQGLAEPFRHVVIEPSVYAAPDDVADGEVQLWWARCDPDLDVDDVVQRTPDGPLLSSNLYTAIEVWTDAELSALHALWALARDRQRDDWMDRLCTARDWHLEHTQPDNATNRPWAFHVFLLDDRPECQHYAQTLLHNALATRGHPDPFSAWIMRDAAQLLETQSTPGQ
ncbi:MAG: hypothetical protein AAF432_06490 [Planctomycetota bacterium]